MHTPSEEKRQMVEVFAELEKELSPLVEMLRDEPFADIIANIFDLNPAWDVAGKENAQAIVSKIKQQMNKELLDEDLDYFFFLNTHIQIIPPLANHLFRTIQAVAEGYGDMIDQNKVTAVIASFATTYYQSLCSIAAAFEGDEGEEVAKVNQYVRERIKELAKAWKIDKPCV